MHQQYNQQPHIDTNQSDIFNSDDNFTAASHEAIIQEENVAVSYTAPAIPENEALYDFEIRDYTNIRTNITNTLQQVNDLEELQKSLRRQIRNQENIIWEQDHQIHMLTRYQNTTIEQQEHQISALTQHNAQLLIQLTDYKNQMAFIHTAMKHSKQ